MLKSNITVKTSDPEQVARIAAKVGCLPMTATVLYNRGVTADEDLRLFTAGTLRDLHSPDSLADMDIAVERIYRAIMDDEKIMISADYDVDGCTATALILNVLEQMGADVFFYVPDRTLEGYGMQKKQITDIAMPQNVGLIITVDNGTGCTEAIQIAKGAGIDVVVTDHHTVQAGENPGALAFINPKRPDDHSGLDYLAGVGVAFYLVVALRSYMRAQGFFETCPEPNLKDYTDLVALGTVADIVPLIGDNRLLVSTGLDVMRQGKTWPGLAALMEVSKIDPEHINSGDLGFKLGPRINAAGRVGHAKTAIDLLITDDLQFAQLQAGRLDDANEQRKLIENRLIKFAEDYLLENPEELERKTLVIAHDQIHGGVMGIVASKLISRYYRPVIMITIDENNIGRGSGRSIPGFNLFDAISACEGNLVKFGGHDMAAGLTVNMDNLEQFKEQLEAYAQENLPDELLTPEIEVDGEIQFGDITERFLDELQDLQPFGAANPEPSFMSREITVANCRVLCDAHRKLRVYQKENQRSHMLDAIHFNCDVETDLPECIEQVAYRLEWNHWNGNKNIQLQVREMT